MADQNKANAQYSLLHDARVSVLGMLCGSLCLLLAVIHFWAGPFAPQPDLEVGLTELIKTVKTAAGNALLDKEASESTTHAKNWTIDDFITVSTAALGVMAVIFGFVAYVKHEPKRPVVAALCLGASGLVFQFVAYMALLIMGVLFIYAVFSNLDQFF